jgi:hypothetical protein
METVPLFRPGEKLVYIQQISTNVVLLWGTRLLAPSLKCWRPRGNPGDLWLMPFRLRPRSYAQKQFYPAH